MNTESQVAPLPASEPRTAWLESVLDGISTVLVTVDPKGRLTHVNGRGLEMLGTTADVVLGRDVLEVFGIRSAWNQCPVQILLSTVLDEGQRIDFPCGVSFQTIYGTHTGWLNVGPLHDAQGKISGAVLIMGINLPQGILPDDGTRAPLTGHAPCDALFVRKDGAYVRVDIDRIQAVEAMENYVSIWTEKERFVVHATMKQLQEKLMPHGFIRVHRSYIVPIDQVRAIEDSRVLIGDRFFPVGKSYRTDLINRLDFI